MRETDEIAGTLQRRAPRSRPTESQATPPLTESRAAPLITLVDCSLSIKRHQFEIYILLGFAAGLAITSLIICYSVGLTDALLGKIASGSLFSMSSLPLKPAFDRFSRAQLLKQVSMMLEQNEPISEIMQLELEKLTEKKSLLG